MIEVVWSLDPKVQRTVEVLHSSGLRLVADETGFRACTDGAGTVQQLMGGLVRGGFRLGRQPLCLHCGGPAEQLCLECVSEGSGPSDVTEEVGETRGGRGRPGSILGVVR
jgi:hypothetical protein